MQIFVKNPSGRVITLEVPLSEDYRNVISELKPAQPLTLEQYLGQPKYPSRHKAK